MGTVVGGAGGWGTMGSAVMERDHFVCDLEVSAKAHVVIATGKVVEEHVVFVVNFER